MEKTILLIDNAPNYALEMQLISKNGEIITQLDPTYPICIIIINPYNPKLVNDSLKMKIIYHLIMTTAPPIKKIRGKCQKWHMKKVLKISVRAYNGRRKTTLNIFKMLG